MSEEDRKFYIEWLLIAYPFKAEAYFAKMSDQALLDEYERLVKIM